uniref:Transthyretin-like family protein n=1 Tax=Steinernema glaseri TaxID=37863 RepID=A0A1I7YX40_9BILA
MRILLVFLLLTAFYVMSTESAFGRTQSVTVSGMLLCRGSPASNIKVKLYDNDRFDVDDLMAEGRTDFLGRFQLHGHETEFTDIDPKVNIYHDCEDTMPCQRKISIDIPDDFISAGKAPCKMFHLGIIELARHHRGETRDCWHK